MVQRSREEETPISPKATSPMPEIFSTKKIFFLNSSCSGSRHSEIPHIESGYCPRDEVSRRLFHPNSGSCDCDCVSDGCCGCLRRNRQVFFKVFVLALSIALVLLLFGSLSYNLTRNKGAEEILEVEKIEFESHYHEYTVKEKNELPSTQPEEPEAVLDFPVPLFDHSNDYESGREHIEPIHLPVLNQPEANTMPTLIYDVREPDRNKRSILLSGEKVAGQKSKNFKKRQSKSLLEKLNGIEEGMETFWESYFKKSETVFEPFSLSTPTYTTSELGDDYVMDDVVIEDELKNKFLSSANTLRVTLHDSDSVTDSAGVTEDAHTSEETSATDATTSRIGEVQSSEGQMDEAGDYVDVTDETTTFDGESEVTKKSAVLGADEFRTWPLFPFPFRLPGILRPNQQDDASVGPPPSNDVKGISLSDAKKLKKDRKKQMLLNSRVVGGSSDVRLPTGPDLSKPIVNAFETLKTNQQLSFTPSAASQFILPYQMCLFPSPFLNPRPVPHMGQPRTFSFGPLAHPFLDGGSPPKGYQPSQQNFLSFNINNFPNAVPPRPPTGSGFGFPAHTQYPYTGAGSNRQPISCTYLQPPFFQFPTVPGTADFSHAKCIDCQDDAGKAALSAKDIFLSGRETLCSSDRVSCVDGSGCVSVANWCDNRVHCKDASDEAFCSCRERIASDRLCDTYVDCPHGEDETGCFDCPKTSFTCETPISPGSCISLSMRCNGVRDCATGADEADCSALFFNIRQNDSYHVSQVSGFLHRNWKGDWFPVCVELGEPTWAKEACASELGFFPSEVEVKFGSVPETYRGPFIVRQEDGKIALQDHCKGHISTFVNCPNPKCGTRVETYYQEFESRYLHNGKIEDSRLKREETGRVVGGRESEPRAWPWAIAVYKDGAFHCGGVILDEKWVLTAAHCMEQYWKHFYEVRGGMLRRFSFSAMEQVRTVSNVIVHENYDQTIMSNDLALLRLREPFHFNRWVRPSCLPTLRDGLSKFFWGPAPGTRCIAVGWGALKERGIDPDQLREVEIPILTRCKHKEDLVGEEICAGKAEGGKDTCQGDSGGPLLCRDSSVPPSWYVAGIVSHGEGCARPGEPGAYTRISLFVDWITTNTNDFQLPNVKPLSMCPGLRCRSGSRLCIPAKWICNGFTDCLEAEDERNCSTTFNYEQRFSENKEILPMRMTAEPDVKEKMLKSTEDLRTNIKVLEITASKSPEQFSSTTEVPMSSKTMESSTEQQNILTTAGLLLEENEPTPVVTKNTEKLSEEAEKDSLKETATLTQLLVNKLEVTEPVRTTTPNTESETTREVADREYEVSVETSVTIERIKATTESNTEEFETSTNYAEEAPNFPTTIAERSTGIFTESSSPLEMGGTTENLISEEKEIFTEIPTQKEIIKAVTESTVKTKLVKGFSTAADIMPITSFGEREISTETIPTDITVTTLSFEKQIEVSVDTFSTVGGIEDLVNITADATEEKEITTSAEEAERESSMTTVEETQTSAMSLQSEEHSVTDFSEAGIVVNRTGNSEEVKTDYDTDEYEVDKSEEKEEMDVEKENEDEGEDGDETDQKEEQGSKEEIGTDEDTSESSEETNSQEDYEAVTNVATVNSESTTAEEDSMVTIPTDASLTITSINPRLLPGTTSRSVESIIISTTPHAIHTRQTTYQNLGISSGEMTTDMSDVVQRNSQNTSAYFQCRHIVQSILQTHRCDGVEDCEDGTDEENCTCAQALLSSNPNLVCDGRIDCPDRSDEMNCATCPKGRYLCPLSRECVPLGERCNGEKNCEFGEDEAQCIGLSRTGEEEQFLQTEGFFMTNKKGIWTVECQEESPLSVGLAIEACSAVGTIGYEKYENRSMGLGCTGLYVTCARNLISSFGRYKSPDGGYRWPWHVFVFADGVPVCFAALLEPRWLLTSSTCLENVSLKSNFVVAKLGSRKQSSRMKEPESRLIRIDGVRTIPDSDMALLHLSREANETEFVRSIGIPQAFESDLESDLCVAVGDRTVFLKLWPRCPDSSRCYKRMIPSMGNCRSKPWSGVIACQSRLGWYPASVYVEPSGHCGFEDVKLTSVQDKAQLIRDSLSQGVELFSEPVCLGFRCSQGLCIPLSKKCNGWPDCSSHEDEGADLCSAKGRKDCNVMELKCRNGRCVPKVFFGDGVDHCGDGSDEPAKVTCAEYLNLTSPERLCDGKRNCYDKSDEEYRMCGCSEHKFQCHRSGHCVPKDFVCDGEEDCPAGEDEDQCMGRKIIKNQEKNYLEVLQNSYGVWHTMCPSEVSKEHSDALCKDLGFGEALFTYLRNQTVLAAEVDAFSWVKLNGKTSVALRGDRPFVRLVTRKRTCAAVKCA